MRKFLTSHKVAGKGISDSLPRQENGICESDRGLRNWAETPDFEAGAGDEIRTHDSLLGKHKRCFSKLERVQNPGFETLTLCSFCPLIRTSQRVTT